MNFKKVKRMFGEPISPKDQCCFCGEAINDKSLVVMNLDLGDDQFQSLYSHGLCLKEKLHPTVPFLAPEEIEGE